MPRTSKFCVSPNRLVNPGVPKSSLIGRFGVFVYYGYMRYICVILGFLTGKTRVRCDECRNLDAEGRCYGHKMPDDVIHKTIACGFWKAK